MVKPKPRLAVLMVVLQVIMALAPAASAAPVRAAATAPGRVAPIGNLNTRALTGSIEGTVTAAGGGGLANIDVQAQSAFDGSWIASDMTDLNGHYLISGLPLGDYKVNFQDYTGYYAPEFYDNVPWGPWENGNDVTVFLGQTTKAAAELALGGRIEGTVRSATDTVLPNIDFSANTTDGTWVNGGQTDSNGTYSMVVPPGVYTVQFWDNNDYWVGEWYNDVPEWEQDNAATVTVSAGKTEPGINAWLDLGGRISGQVTDTSGNPLPNIQFAVYDPADQQIAGGQTDENGNYLSPVLPLGDYKVQFWDDNNFWASEYYNDKREWQSASADLVTVIAGATAGGIDAALEAAQPRLRTMIEHDWVEGQGFPVETTVTVSINSGAKADFDVKTNPEGRFNSEGSEYWPENRIARGDEIVVSYDSSETSMVVQNISGAVDPDADEVTGTALAGQDGAPLAGETVKAELWTDDSEDPAASKSATAASDGSFAFDFSGAWDIVRGNQVFATHTSPQGHQTLTELYNALPVLGAQVDHNWVDGNNFPPDTTMTVSVSGGANGTTDIKTDPGGNFFVDVWETWGERVARGDLVTATDGSEETTMAIQNLNATVDLDNNKVAGTALAPGGSPLAGRRIQVNVNSGDWQQELATADATVAGDGSFSVDLGGFDLVRGEHVQVTLFDSPNGDFWRHRTLIEPYNAIPTLGAMVDHNWLDGRDFPRDTSVTVSISGSVNAEFEIKTDQGGNFWAGSENWNWQQIAPGNVITASTGSAETSMVVQNVSGSVDIALDDVTGTAFDANTGAPLTGDIHLSIQEDWGEEYPVVAEGDTTVGPGGEYALDFSGEWDIVRGNKLFLTHTSPQGHRTMIAPYNDFFRNYVNLTQEYIGGQNYPTGSKVNVAVRDGAGNLKAETSATVTAWDGGSRGDFWLDGIGGDAPFDVRSGDIVDIKPSGEATVSIETSLTGAVDLGVNEIAGATRPNSMVDIEIGRWLEDLWDTTSVAANPAGAYAYTPSFNMAPDDWVWVRYTQLEGEAFLNEVSINPPTALRGTTVQPRWGTIAGAGYPLDTTITVEARDDGSNLKGSATANTRESGAFWFVLKTPEGEHVNLIPGDTVSVTVGQEAPLDIAVVRLWGYLDLDDDTINGKGPVDKQIKVSTSYWDSDGWHGAEATVTADSTGSFLADFSGVNDIRADSWSTVTYTDANANKVQFVGWPQNGYGDSISDTIWADGLPGEETATVEIGGRLAYVWTGDFGELGFNAADFAPPLDLLGGELVTVTHSKGQVSFHVNGAGTIINPATPNGDNGWYKTSPTVTVTPDETARVYYSLDSTAGNWIGDSFFDVFLDIDIPDGIHTLYSYLVYPWEETGPISETGELKVDTAVPTGASVSINAGAAVTNSTSVNLNLAAQDGGGSGVSLMRFRNAGGAWSPYEPYGAGKALNLPAGDGPKRVYAQFKDTAGNESGEVFDDITLTTVIPDAAAPSATISSPKLSTDVSKNKAFNVAWSGADSGGSGIASYDVQVKVSQSGVWTAWKTGTTAVSAVYTGSPGKTYYFRARATDGAGNVGAYSGEAKTIVPYDNNSLIKSKVGFASTVSAAKTKYYLGTARYSTKGGDEIIYAFTGNHFSLIGNKGPKYSKAVVTIDGVKKTIDAKAGSLKFRQVLVTKTWTGIKKHTVKIKNLGTAGRTRFDIDGSAVGK